jgi:hypothetical protein
MTTRTDAVGGAAATDGWRDARGLDLITALAVIIGTVGEHRVRSSPSPWRRSVAARISRPLNGTTVLIRRSSDSARVAVPAARQEVKVWP